MNDNHPPRHQREYAMMNGVIILVYSTGFLLLVKWGLCS